MALVKITNGDITLEVSSGAFANSYKNCGFSVVESDAEETILEIAEDEDESEELEVQQENIVQKPIGSWTKQELKDFAKKNDIDTAGATSTQEVKAIIKEFIDNSK